MPEIIPLAKCKKRRIHEVAMIPQWADTVCVSVARRLAKINRRNFYDFDDYLQDARMGAMEALACHDASRGDIKIRVWFLASRRALGSRRNRADVKHESYTVDLGDIDIGQSGPSQEISCEVNKIIGILSTLAERDASAFLALNGISGQYDNGSAMARGESVSAMRISQLSQRAKRCLLNVLNIDT